jgi:hypothetical protein
MQNEFSKNGVAYVAVPGDNCDECAFRQKCIAETHPCWFNRDDGQDITWQRKLHEAS